LSARWLRRKEEERKDGGQRGYLYDFGDFAKDWIVCWGSGLG